VTNALLELQRLDSNADALRARRAGLQERALLRECEAAMAALVAERTDAYERRTALARLEHDAGSLVADLEARAHDVETTLYAGKVRAIKELEALQVELRECKRRQIEAEDQEFALMEQQERADAEIVAMEVRHGLLEVQAEKLRGVIAAEEARIDEEITGIVAQRAVLNPPVPAAVLTLYEKMRGFPRLGGLVAVSTVGGTCAGCKTVLPILLTSRLTRGPVNDVVQCVNCLRILVA
jgi:hypothetical protein